MTEVNRFPEDNLQDADDAATIPVEYYDEEEEVRGDQAMEEDVEMVEEKEKEGMETQDLHRDAQEVIVDDVPETEVGVEVGKEDAEGLKEDTGQSCQVDVTREREGTPVESVDRRTLGEGGEKKGVEEENSGQKQEVWTLEDDEMTILGQFMHSESGGSGTDTKGHEGAKPKRSNQRSAAPSLSRVPSDKHVTIATEDAGPTASQGTRGRRDPYEFTESQSNKTPTPMKTWGRKENTAPKDALPTRNLEKGNLTFSCFSSSI